MDGDSVPLLLVTANVGSVFEDPSRLLKTWISEFLNKITMLKPQFVALHMQEVGGKTYEKSMEYVQEFIQLLCESTELENYNRIRIYLDEDYTSAEHFTALGNLYFVEKSLQMVKIWNFLTHEWESADGKDIHTGNIEAVATKEKAKFPQHFFPECKWSRKGFLRTRWDLKGTVIDMVNIHLFHDASNLAACEECPSVYCKSRRRALVHTLERFHTDFINGMAPYFVFGDFNFRCDTEGVVKKLTEDLSVHRIMNIKNDHTKVQYRNLEGNNVLTVGKKEFNHAEHQIKFKESWLQQFDRELEPLKEVLVEYPITFSPSYPYEEEPSLPHNYMSTRCPAWCDRILMNPTAKDLIIDDNFSSKDYNIIGDDVCMGDHKPVYLNIRMKVFQGTIKYSCEHAYNNVQPPTHCVTNHSAAFDNNANTKQCLYSSVEFYKVLLECIKLNSLNRNINVCSSSVDVVSVPVTDLTEPQTKTQNSDYIYNQQQSDQNHRHRSRNNIRPKISINITDTENENVCMCSLYASTDKVDLSSAATPNQQKQIAGQMERICSECQNIIKQQPTEHRKTLISKRLTLSNDIIVNRVDTHYLTLNTNSDKFQDPYTPESIESHSPLPDSVDFDMNEDGTDEHIVDGIDETKINLIKDKSDQDNEQLPQGGIIESDDNNFIQSTSTRGVSPRQLKSRLERLQRPSSSKIKRKCSSSAANKNRCFDRFCQIL